MTKVEELKLNGNSAMQSENYDEAIRNYTEAIRLDPSNHILFSNRSAAYTKTGDFAQALKDASKTVELKKDWPKGYSRKATALKCMGRYDDAINAYSEGLNYDSNNVELKEALTKCQECLKSSRLAVSTICFVYDLFVKYTVWLIS